MEPEHKAIRGNRHRPWPHGAGLSLQLAAVLLLLAACAQQQTDTSHLAALEVPAEYTHGRDLFDTHCSVCHGPQATGTDAAPPLVHSAYRPLHHGDEAFQLAVAQGVRAHHFRFGDMPPIPGVTREEVSAITAYVRWLQRAAGIE